MTCSPHPSHTQSTPILPSIMPGLSAIFGLIPCSNSRHLYTEKPRTVTMDCEIVIGVDDKGDVNTTSALLHYFIPLGAPEPINGALHFVFGRVASIDSSENVGDGFSPLEYDFIIDADMVCDSLLSRLPVLTSFLSSNQCLKTSLLVRCLLSLSSQAPYVLLIYHSSLSHRLA
jgi:hypothetical protein